MDVLHLIKTDHEEIRSGFKGLADIGGQRRRREALDGVIRDLGVHLTLEKDFIYPEVQGLFQGANEVIDRAAVNHQRLRRKASALRRFALKSPDDENGLSNKVKDLGEDVRKHFALSEEQIMPKMRGLIRTEDREDLGEVFLDVKEDLRKEAESASTTGNRRKKRA